MEDIKYFFSIKNYIFIYNIRNLLSRFEILRKFMEPLVPPRCDLLKKAKEIWNYSLCYYSPINFKIFDADYKAVALIIQYCKVASYTDVLKDKGDLFHLLDIYTNYSNKIDFNIFNLFEKALTEEKSLNENKLAISILEFPLLSGVVSRAIYISGTQFIERSKKLLKMATEIQENYGLKESGKTLEIGAELPELNEFTLIQLKNLALKGGKPECKRMCHEYNYELGFSFFYKHIICYHIDEYHMKCFDAWLELVEVITKFVDAKDFVQCFAKSCPGCMMISLFALAIFCNSKIFRIETIIRNLFHDKNGRLVEGGETENIGKQIVKSLKPRQDKQFTGNCLDIGMEHPLTIYLNNLGSLACSDEFLKAMDTDQAKTLNVFENNVSFLNKDDGYKQMLEKINN